MNLARIDGLHDIAPDNLVCLDLVIEIFAGANEHACTGLQVRGVDHLPTLKIARIEPQQDRFHAPQTRVQDDPISSQFRDNAGKRDIATRRDQIDGTWVIEARPSCR